MAKLTKYAGSKALFSDANGARVHLYKSFDLVHGRGWFCHIWYDNYANGFGFSKNRFTAYRNAIKNRFEEYDTNGKRIKWG